MNAGNNNTHIFVAQAGRQIPFDTETVGLPNEEGILDSTLKEYDMTNSEMLGGFIRWARQAYDDAFPHAAPDPLPTQAQATIPTFFSFVGHGLPLAPQDSSFGQMLPLQQPTKPTVDPFDPLGLLGIVEYRLQVLLELLQAVDRIGRRLVWGGPYQTSRTSGGDGQVFP